MAIAAAACGGADGCELAATCTTSPISEIVSFSPNNAIMQVGESRDFFVQITNGRTGDKSTLAACTSGNTARATAVVEGAVARRHHNSCVDHRMGCGLREHHRHGWCHGDGDRGQRVPIDDGGSCAGVESANELHCSLSARCV